MKSPRSALVIGAHPDDCEFGAGATVAKWTQNGCEVHFCIVTDGGKGSADLPANLNALVKQRRREQQNAATMLGVASCRFLGFPDGEVTNDDKLLGSLVKEIRELQPEVVLTHSPEPLDHRPFQGRGKGINHRDHRAVGQAALDAVYPYARNPNSFPELDLQPHRVSKVLLWGGRHCDLSIEVGDMMLKAQALAAHQSQFPEGTDWPALVSGWGTTEDFEVVEV